MKKLLTEEEVDALLTKKRLTYEEQQTLKYRRDLIQIQEIGANGFIKHEAIQGFFEHVIRNPLIMVSVFAIMVGGLFVFRPPGFEGVGSWFKLAMDIFPYIAFYLAIAIILALLRVVRAVKLTKYDIKMYDNYIKTGKLNQSLAMTNIERLFKKAESGLTNVFWIAVSTVGAIAMGVLWTITGVYNAFLSNQMEKYVFPVNILFQGFMVIVIIAGMSAIIFGVRNVRAFLTKRY